VQIGQMHAVWAEGASDGDLSSFAPYPSSFSTTAGEALIMLPQQLEVLLGEEQGSASGGELASQWLDRVASGVAEELTSSVMAIPQLGAKVCMTRMAWTFGAALQHARLGFLVQQHLSLHKAT
jgi:hypothetical protein